MRHEPGVVPSTLSLLSTTANLVALTSLLLLPVGAAAAPTISEFERSADQWLAAAGSSEGYSFDGFFPGIAGATGCLVSPSTAPATLALAGGTVTVRRYDAGAVPICAIADGSTPPRVSDGFSGGGSRFVMSFDPPVSAFHTYYGSLPSGQTSSMKLFSGGVEAATLVSPSGVSTTLAIGHGFVSSTPIDSIEVTSTDAAIAVGAFVGLVSGEPSLGTEFVAAYGASVQRDFACTFVGSDCTDGFLVFAHDFENTAGATITALCGPDASKTSGLSTDGTAPSSCASQHVRSPARTSFETIDTNARLTYAVSELSFSILYNARNDNSTGTKRFLSTFDGTGSLGTDQMVFDRPSGSGQLRMFTNGQGVASDGTIPQDNAWHQVGFTFTNGTVRFYLDGLPFGSDKTFASVVNIGSQAFNWHLIEDVAAVSNLTEYFSNGDYDAAQLWTRALCDEEMSALFQSGCLVSVSGSVVSDCAGPLQGVTVDLLTDSEFLTTFTDGAGAYSFMDVVGGGSGEVSIVVPLGFVDNVPSEADSTIVLDQSHVVDFSLLCLASTGDARSKGYWKHQASVYVKNKGSAQESETDMRTTFPNALFTNFHNNQLASIAVEGITFMSGPVAVDLDTLLETLKKKGSMVNKAKQQYMALLLNMASGKVLSLQVVSDDGATASQAIQDVAAMINDTDPANDELAKDIAETINHGDLVAAGAINTSLANITYARPRFVDVPLRVSPNPGGAQNYTFSFAIPQTGRATLEIFNVAGRRVATPLSGDLETGRRVITWNGRTASGSRIGHGVYFARLTSPQGSKTVKFVHLAQ